MVKKLCMVGMVAAMAAAPAAFAGSMPAGAVAGYVTMSEIDVEAFGKDDGNGFGLKGWASLNGPWFVHGEYQTTSLDDLGGDLESLRLGGGFTGDMGSGMMWMAKAEYVDFGSDADESGFGVHGGLMFGVGQPLSGFATIGYLMLGGDDVDVDGIEFDVGAKYSFTKEWAGFADYRAFMGGTDPDVGDFEVTDIRIGAAYSFY